MVISYHAAGDILCHANTLFPWQLNRYVHHSRPQCTSWYELFDARHNIKKVEDCVQLFTENPSQSYRESPAVWNHTVLPATRHRWMHPAITHDREAGIRFTYPGGMEGWVDLGAVSQKTSPMFSIATWKKR